MARVYSWKLPDGRYAYMDPSGKYIRDGRISDTSELQSIGDSVRKMTPAEYQRVFNSVKSAVDSTGYILKDWSYYFDVTGDGGSIFISGRDGAGSGSGSGSGGSTPGGGGNIYNPYEEMDKLKEEVDKMLKDTEANIKKSTEAAVNESVNKLNEDISNANKELGDIKDRFTKTQNENEQAFQDLKDWLASLETGSGEGNSEELNAILREFPYIKEWYEKNKDADLGFAKDAIDELTGRIGTVEASVKALDGRISVFATNIDTMNSTVATVEREMSAVDAKIKDMVTYANLEESAQTIVLRQMEALSGTIKDEILRESALDGETVDVLRQMSQEGWIEDKVAAMTSGTTTVLGQKFSAIDASINEYANYVNSALSASTRIEEDWNAKEAEITKALTTVNEVSGTVSDIRQEWSKSSGIVQTVGEFLKKEDGTYETDMMSYMNQTVSGITMGVIDKELSGPKIFALMTESDDEDGKSSLAGMVADKILLSGDTFMTNIISEKGIIAGADFNGGTITYSDSNGNINYQLTSGGSLYARDGRIEGNFTIGDTVKVSSLTTIPKNGNARIDVMGSTMNVYGSSGSRNIEFGVDDATGFAVLKFYDNDGNLLYDLGPQGIRLFGSGLTTEKFIYVSVENESWSTLTGYFYLGDTIEDVITNYFSDSSVYTGSDTPYDWVYTGKTIPIVDNTRGKETQIYQFRAARADGKITTGDFATSIEMAEQLDGKVYSSKKGSLLSGIYYNYVVIDFDASDSNFSFASTPSYSSGYLNPTPADYTESMYASMGNGIKKYYDSFGIATLGGGSIDWTANASNTGLLHPVVAIQLVKFVDGVSSYSYFYFHNGQ